MGLDGEGVEELLFEAESAGDAVEVILGEESVVESHSSADAVAGAAETESGDDDQIDQIERDGVAGDRFADAGAGDGDVGGEAGDFDGHHAFLIPADLGNDDGFVILPAAEGEGGGVELEGHGEVEHDHASGGELGCGGDQGAGGQGFVVALLGIKAGEHLAEVFAG